MDNNSQLSLIDDVLVLGEPESKETATIRQIKEKLGAMPEEKGDRLSVTFKMSRARHGRLLGAIEPHKLTMTDLFTLWVDQITPVLQKARPVEVASFKPDDRRARPKPQKRG